MMFHTDGSQPKNNQVFVFGSNEAGRHGAGAAKAARLHYGAEYGNGYGLQGQSYAIPTKDGRIKTLSLEAIKRYVNEFKLFAKNNPQLEFFVTRIGCGLAGYNDSDIAPMFVGSPSNCSFANQWKTYLNGAHNVKH
jgi:hypothetical protein